jgi:hypothetical protein
MSGIRDTIVTLGPWGSHDIVEGEDLELQFGSLALRLARESGEIRVAAAREEEDRDEEPDWTRWAPADWEGELSLTPALPDRTVIVQPEDAFWLLAGAEARIYVRIPLCVRIDALGTQRTQLTTIPVVELSDTWWGTLEEGELCYWIRTAARRRVTSEQALHLAICPLQLINHSDDDLHVDKIALRVEYLSLHADCEGAIWSSETRVRYLGESEGSRLEVSGDSPTEAPEAELMTPPRARMAKGLTARTFARLKSIQGWI